MSVAMKDRRLDSLTQTLAAKVAAGAEPGTITGTAVRYNVDVDRGGGWLFLRLLPGCFAEQVKDPARVKVLWQHDPWEPIGKVHGLADTKARLDFDARIEDSANLPTAVKALELLRTGVLDEVSVGFDIKKFTREEDQEKDTVTYIVSKAVLREISVVTFGALGQSAKVDQVASESGPDLARSVEVRVREARRMAAELARLRA